MMDTDKAVGARSAPNHPAVQGGTHGEYRRELLAGDSQPARWGSFSGASLAVEVLAKGEGSGDGCLEIRCHGVASATTARNQVFLAGVDTIAAASGQHWVVSALVEIVGGSQAGISSIAIAANVHNVKGQYSSWMGAT